MMRRATKPDRATPTLTSPVPNPRTPRKKQPSTATAPTAPANLPVIVVGRRPVCHWARCSKPAEVRVGFAPPSLLSSEPDRPYCLLHADKVSGAQGVALVGRLELAEGAGRNPA